MSTIGIDTRWLAIPASGIGQYITSLIRGLETVDRTNQYKLWGTPAKYVSAPNFENVSFQGKYQYAWENIWHLTKWPGADQIGPKTDLWHFTNYSTMPTSRPYVLTVYDLVQHYYPEYVAEKTLQRLQKYLPRSLEKAEHILTISEATKKSFIEVMGVPEEKITVTLLAAEQIFHDPISPETKRAVAEKYALPKDYVLAVGTLEPRKNLRTLLEAYALLKPDQRQPLVVVGGQGWSFDETKALIGELKLADEVIFTGYVPDEDLPALYAGATVFVFPTHYEGFGIPVAEAMAVGVPVICSNTSSVPEVAGPAGRMFDPNSSAELADTLKEVLGSRTLQDEMATASQAQGRKFSWQETARQTHAVYQRVLGGSA
jgi:glycosyltransferase involved in cell wall biosynthesis